MSTNPVAVIRSWSSSDGSKGRHIYVWCPGCAEHTGGLHAVEIDPSNTPCWGWNGDLANLTVTPSIRVLPGRIQPLCHSFITGGQWNYLGDCTHHLAGQTLPLPPLPDWVTEPACP